MSDSSSESFERTEVEEAEGWQEESINLDELNDIVEQVLGETPTTTEDQQGTTSEEPTLVEETRRTTTATSIMTSKEVSLGSNGPKHKILTTKKTRTKNRGFRILHKKEDRESLSADDRETLMQKATSKAHKKYDVLNLGLEDEDKLDDTYDLQVLVKLTKAAHYKFDVHDVFTIVIPDESDETTITKSYDLYGDFESLSIKQVARSNQWYNDWSADGWVEDNLTYTHEFFQNNVEEDLWMKISEEYDEHDDDEKGGPLFFIIMMKHLLSDTESAIDSLTERVRSFKIQSLQGEDIFRAVSLLRSALVRLKHLNAEPKDTVKIVLKVMQTSSVPEFNKHFERLDEERKRDSAWNETTNNTLTPDKLFKLAQSLYRDMLENDTWTGVKTKGQGSTFNVQHGNNKVKCFNCGGNHMVTTCNKPKDQKKISENRKAFIKNAPTRGTSNGNPRTDQYRPPQKGENGKRVINGKPMYYHYKSKKWIPDRDATTTGAPAPAPEPTATPARAETPTTQPAANIAATPAPEKESGPTTDKAELKAHIANTSKQISSAFANFTEGLLNDIDDP